LETDFGELNWGQELSNSPLASHLDYQPPPPAQAPPGTNFDNAHARGAANFRDNNLMPEGTQAQHWNKKVPSEAANLHPDIMNENMSPLQSRKDEPATTLLTDYRGGGTTYSTDGVARKPWPSGQKSPYGANAPVYQTEHKFADNFLIPTIADRMPAGVDPGNRVIWSGAEARWIMTGHPGQGNFGWQPAPLGASAPPPGPGSGGAPVAGPGGPAPQAPGGPPAAPATTSLAGTAATGMAGAVVPWSLANRAANLSLQQGGQGGQGGGGAGGAGGGGITAAQIATAALVPGAGAVMAGQAAAGWLVAKQEEHRAARERQEAAHRGQFTADNQPGKGVERVNPDYSEPPGTPQQLEAIKVEIANLLANRARVEQAAARMGAQEQQHQAHQGPIQQAVQETAGGVTAAQAHQQAVARREQANQAQQQRQQEAGSLISGYPSRAAGLTVLTVPLAGFERFTHYASDLPGDVGGAMERMNADAQRMQDAFAQMATAMATQDEAQPARQQELQGDQSRIQAADAQATTAEQDLQRANEGAQGLQEANETRIAEATAAREEAVQQGAELEAAQTTKEEQAQTLAEQLQSWAQEHKAARQTAIEQTVQNVEAQGYVVLERTEE
jgi:hypothetical protein